MIHICMHATIHVQQGKELKPLTANFFNSSGRQGIYFLNVLETIWLIIETGVYLNATFIQGNTVVAGADLGRGLRGL